MYHKKQLFISIAKIQAELEAKYAGKRIFTTFFMPMIVLAIRMEVEVIFKNTYPEFFSEETQEKIAMKLINDLITKLIDPNIFYSRFSFFESGRDAINIKYSVSPSKIFYDIYFLSYRKPVLQLMSQWETNSLLAPL